MEPDRSDDESVAVRQSFARDALLRRMPWEGAAAPDWAPLVDREWLVTNGLGGYASGTVSGAATRRYHGLLVAAHPPPLGRVVTLTEVAEKVELPDGETYRLGGDERPEALELHGARHLDGFHLEWGLPVWVYRFGEALLEKRLFMPRDRNACVIEWRLVRGPSVRLELRPAVRFRRHDTPVSEPLERGYDVEHEPEGLRVTAPAGFPDLRLRLGGEAWDFREAPAVHHEILYRVEASRGYTAVGDTWSPGTFRTALEPGGEVAMVASTDEPDRVPSPEDATHLREREWERRGRLLQRAHPALRRGQGAELVVAADAFVVTPPRRSTATGSRSVSGDGRTPSGAPSATLPDTTIIAGYHWFTDWGRDTMISLEGLTLVTGRTDEAGSILRTFGRHVRDGLIPNLFPEGGDEGVYHTADATLWFFHALDRYMAWTADATTLRLLLPVLRGVVEHHRRGTRFGIGVDPEDGLLRQGADGFQLTWMDAKVGDWVVTPRRGKAVEINALWYNALRLMERWEAEHGDGARSGEMRDEARRVRESFNRRFWMEDERRLYDVVDGWDGESAGPGGPEAAARAEDPAFRPNQVFAVSLPHAVLEEDRWRSVVDQVEQRLLTPVGLRSLAPGHPDYRETYFGNLRARDAAYHQGTVWGWLIGPFIDAWLRVHPGEEARARGFLEGLLAHLDEFGLGSLAEIFDAQEPHTPRGCIAQAWSVAEVLRALVRIEGGLP